jgi:hypothetical protein
MSGVRQCIAVFGKPSRKVLATANIWELLREQILIFLGEEYDHTPHSLPKGVMKAIRPVFEELASRK